MTFKVLVGRSLHTMAGCRSDLHNELIATLALDYLDGSIRDGSDRKRFILNCRKYLKTPREQAIQDVVQIFDILEAKGLLAEGDYKVLKELVQNINRNLVKLIEETERKMNGEAHENAQTAVGSDENRRKENKGERGQNVYNTYNISHIDAPNGVIAIANSDQAAITQNT